MRSQRQLRASEETGDQFRLETRSQAGRRDQGPARARTHAHMNTQGPQLTSPLEGEGAYKQTDTHAVPEDGYIIM